VGGSLDRSGFVVRERNMIVACDPFLVFFNFFPTLLLDCFLIFLPFVSLFFHFHTVPHHVTGLADARIRACEPQAGC